jgi:hypothetical protein
LNEKIIEPGTILDSITGRRGFYLSTTSLGGFWTISSLIRIFGRKLRGKKIPERKFFKNKSGIHATE